MTWHLVWSDDAARDLRRLLRGNPDQATRVTNALDRFALDGYGDVRRLQGRPQPTYRLRVGEWRVLFELDYPSHILTIRRVLPRGSAY